MTGTVLWEPPADARETTRIGHYLSWLERERGPHPSEQMIASLAQGLHLSLDERDHLFSLAGHTPPARGAAGA